MEIIKAKDVDGNEIKVGFVYRVMKQDILGLRNIVIKSISEQCYVKGKVDTVYQYQTCPSLYPLIVKPYSSALSLIFSKVTPLIFNSKIPPRRVGSIS